MVAAAYQLHGLRVRSEVPLHAQPGLDGPDADLTVTWGPPGPVTDDPPAGETVAELIVAGYRYYTGVRDGDAHVLRSHGLCDFHIGLASRSIECRPDPEIDPAFVPILLGGTVSAFYLGLAGRNVLHGSAVEVDGRGIAFIGHSGAGKSTMAAMMCAAGGRLLSDDVLHLELDDGVRCLGRAAELRLRQTSLSVLDGLASPSARLTVDGKVAVAFAAASPDCVPLSRVVIPMPSRTTSAVQVRPLRGAEAVLALSRFPRILGWLAPDIVEAQFTFSADLAQRVPVCEALVPWGPPFTAALAREVLDHLDRDA